MRVNLDNVKIEHVAPTLTNRVHCIKEQLINGFINVNYLHDVDGGSVETYRDSDFGFYVFKRMNGEYLLYINYDVRAEAPEYMYTGKAGKVYRYERKYSWVIYVNDKFIVDGVINE